MRLSMLRGHDRTRLTVDPDADVRSAMRLMNETGRTLVLVVDGERLEGVVADGDIRRYLARGGELDDPIATVTNRTPITLASTTSTSNVRAFMVRRGLEYVPLVDGEAVDALAILERSTQATELSAVVMCGGLGTRLAPLTDHCPKPLLPLGGTPMLTHIIDHLRTQGVNHFVLAVNHLAHMIVDHYNDGAEHDCFIDYVHETKRLGTGGALSLVDADSLSDPFICINGDAVNDIDVGALVDAHTRNDWEATMVVRSHSETIAYGVVDTDESGNFVQIREKPTQRMMINAGIYLLGRSALDLVPRGEYFDLPTLFESLVSGGRRGGTFEHRGRWIDIGSHAEYDRAKAIFADAGPTS